VIGVLVQNGIMTSERSHPFVPMLTMQLESLYPEVKGITKKFDFEID
jgi:hypothetical protein